MAKAKKVATKKAVPVEGLSLEDMVTTANAHLRMRFDGINSTTKPEALRSNLLDEIMTRVKSGEITSDLEGPELRAYLNENLVEIPEE